LRAGPLSNNEVINLLNRYYVPVASSNFATDPNGPAPDAEKKEHRRIYLDFYNRKLGVGDVHVYILRPDLTSLGGLDIGSALQQGKLAKYLEDVRTQLGTPAGDPAFPPHAWSTAPDAPADSMVFHLVARRSRYGTWHEFPSENWIVLGNADWRALLPPETPSAGGSWQVPQAVTDKLLTWFLPQAEEVSWDSRSRIDEANLRMTVTRLENGLARARITGSVRLLHSMYPHRAHDDFSTAQLNGFMDFAVAEGRIQRLRIVAEKAVYMDEPFEAALASVSRETLDALQ